ncbi:MAG: hypothetical protein KUL88_01745 [Rhizobium sp.]|nr:hypothetical protein [Rhizobium sp.]
MERCAESGCEAEVSQKGHTLCYEHWKLKQEVGSLLSASALASEFGLKKPTQINRVFFDLGWIERSGKKGWKPTEQGLRLKAEAKRHFQTRVDYVLWPGDIAKSRILQRAVAELIVVEEKETPAMAAEVESEVAYKPEGFREKYPATKRSNDGHMVRSRAEALIDNWLYEQRIAHAYERLVPIEEPMYCDFYLPEIDVYIEFWGMENNPRYMERKQLKLRLYKDSGLRLIEIRDKDIDNLDDFLLQALIKFGYQVK